MPSYKLALTVVILLSSVLFASQNDDPVKKFFKTANWLGTEFAAENGVAVLNSTSFETPFPLMVRVG